MKLDGPKCLLFGALALPSGRPTIEIQGFHLVESQGEHRSLELTSQKANVYKAQGISALEELRAFVWGQFRKPFEASGKMGILDSESQNFSIFEGSRLISPDGYHFQTSSFDYDSKTRSFHGKESVVAEKVDLKGSAPLKMTGLGFVVDLNKSLYSIQRDVSAKQILPNGEIILVTALSALMSPKQKNATFLKKVLVKSPKIEMKGERLVVKFADDEDTETQTPSDFTLDSPEEGSTKAKKISANFNGMLVESKGLSIKFAKDGSLDYTEAIGEVSAKGQDGLLMKSDKLVTRMVNGKSVVFMKKKVIIETKDRTATCEEAEYYPDNGNILLKTFAAVRNNQQVLEGDVIHFSTKNSEVSVERARGQVSKKDFGLR